MRKTILVLGAALLIAPNVLAQRGETEAVRARMASDAERMRGEKVPIKDETLKAGRDVDLPQLQKKQEEMKELVQSINVDLQNMQAGVRAADLPQKLKKLEKLAKELRQRLE
jgi:hypothetical protein